MKLLFDHNISHKLVAQLADIFPDSSQPRLLNLSRTNDSQLWLIAKAHQFVFVSKDRDVAELAVFRGAPPKVIGCGWATAKPRRSNVPCAPT